MSQIDALFIAPHLDDVVYSCGGTVQQLTQQGLNVVVLTIFAGLPPATDLSEFAQSLHERWGHAAPTSRNTIVETRQLEDIAACHALGAGAIHMDYGDCIYRQDNGEWLYASEDAIFGAVHPAEEPRIQQLIEDIYRTPGVDENTRLFGPLGIGNHVDHQLVHQALLQCDDVLFYEDYPYAENNKALYPYLRDANWQPAYRTLAATAINAKATAMALYQSQLTTFWANKSVLNKNVTTYWQRRGQAERFWKFTGDLA